MSFSQNSHGNDNLEEQAQALFRFWFVDFEPFQEGDFIDTEFGSCPKGWDICVFGDFLQESRQKVEDATIPEYSVTNTGIWPRNQKFNKSLSKSSINNKVVNFHDLVFGMSREILNWGIMEDTIGGVSPAYHVYNVDQSIVKSLYLKLFIKHYKAYFATLIRPAAREGQGVDKAALMKKQICIPPLEIWEQFCEHYNLLEQTKNRKTKETLRLTELRDTLLPKLMSGELKIKKRNL